jgi:hypothetical protein
MIESREHFRKVVCIGVCLLAFMASGQGCATKTIVPLEDTSAVVSRLFYGTPPRPKPSCEGVVDDNTLKLADIAQIQLRTNEAVPLLREGLSSQDESVRFSAFLVLIRIPEVGRRYVLEGLASTERKYRVFSLEYGLTLYAANQDVATACWKEINRLHASGEDISITFEDVRVNSIHPDVREALREFAEDRVKEKHNSLFLFLVADFRDERAANFLYSVARKVSPGADSSINYSELPDVMLQALALINDRTAVARIAAMISRTVPVSDRDSSLALRFALKHLSADECIQRAFLKRLGTARQYRQYEKKVKRWLSSYTDVIILEWDEMVDIHEAATSLANNLGIRPTANRCGILNAQDVDRIRRTASRLLDQRSKICGDQSSDHHQVEGRTNGKQGEHSVSEVR